MTDEELQKKFKSIEQLLGELRDQVFLMPDEEELQKRFKGIEKLLVDLHKKADQLNSKVDNEMVRIHNHLDTVEARIATS